MFMPRSPISASFSMAEGGMASSRSQRAACAANSPRQSVRTASRIWTWSSVRSRFMVVRWRRSGRLMLRRFAEHGEADDRDDAHDAGAGPEQQRAERVLLQHLAGHHHLLHFGRAFVDLADPRVAPVALDVVLAHVTVTAVHLDREVRAVRGGFGGVPLGERSFLRVWPPQVAEPC